MIRKKKFGLENSFQAQNNYQPTYPGNSHGRGAKHGFRGNRKY
jgi:hypothetical protein